MGHGGMGEGGGWRGEGGHTLRGARRRGGPQSPGKAPTHLAALGGGVTEERAVVDVVLDDDEVDQVPGPAHVRQQGVDAVERPVRRRAPFGAVVHVHPVQVEVLRRQKDGDI